MNQKTAPSPIQSIVKMIRFALLFCMAQSLILFASYWAYKRFSPSGNSFAKDTSIAIQAMKNPRSYQLAEQAMAETEGPATALDARSPAAVVEDLQKENKRLKFDLWKLETKCRQLPNN